MGSVPADDSAPAVFIKDINRKERMVPSMKKTLSLILTLCLLLIAAAVGTAETTVENGILPAIAGENGTTYVSLFDVIISDRWTPVWQDYIAAVIGEEDIGPAGDGSSGAHDKLGFGVGAAGDYGHYAYAELRGLVYVFTHALGSAVPV